MTTSCFHASIHQQTLLEQDSIAMEARKQSSLSWKSKKKVINREEASDHSYKSSVDHIGPSSSSGCSSSVCQDTTICSSEDSLTHTPYQPFLLVAYPCHYGRASAVLVIGKQQATALPNHLTPLINLIECWKWALLCLPGQQCSIPYLLLPSEMKQCYEGDACMLWHHPCWDNYYISQPLLWLFTWYIHRTFTSAICGYHCFPAPGI